MSAGLTPQLAETLALIRAGKSTREAAAELGCSINAVQQRVTKLKRLGHALESIECFSHPESEGLCRSAGGGKCSRPATHGRWAPRFCVEHFSQLIRVG